MDKQALKYTQSILYPVRATKVGTFRAITREMPVEEYSSQVFKIGLAVLV